MESTNFKLISKIYLRPVNCFDLNFVFGTSWWKSPTPGISSLSIWLFFFHPNRHSVPEKAKKVVKIFHRWRRRPWEFFFPGLFFSTTWPSYFYFCTSIVRSRAQKSWRKWWWCYQTQHQQQLVQKWMRFYTVSWLWYLLTDRCRLSSSSTKVH